MEGLAKENLLRSWKEISAYLGCDERTCYRWEKRFGMPVHRADDGISKSRVFAYKDELDLWFQETFKNSHPPVFPKPVPRPSVRWVLIGLVPVWAVVIFMLARTAAMRHGQPMDFHIRGTTLIILGDDGKELWRKDTKADGLEDEAFYRARFQVVNAAVGRADLPSLMIKDIDGDGRKEVVFAVQKRGDSYGEGDLYCYDSRGRERWHFAAGREMSFGGMTYSPDYRIRGFNLHDFNGDGRQEVTVISYHFPQWPCQLAVFDCNGKPMGQFWNSGYLTDVRFQDLDGDGREEMIVSGVNNEYGGCVIVFDPTRVDGCSPQTGAFRSDTLPPGSEKYYVRTPRTDVSLALGDIVEDIDYLGVTKNQHLEATTGYGLAYEFDFGLRCLNAVWGHGYMMKHNELAAAGKIRSALDEAYRQTIISGVRYWNGRAWVAEPKPNLGHLGPDR
jgi:hypothetical protein